MQGQGLGITSRLEEEFDFDIVDEFINHFETMSYTIEPTIINLEQVEFFAGSIEELFRVFHNLKSATGFLHLERMNRMCQIVENSLDLARSLKGPASMEYVDWLLKVEDQFNLWLDDLREDRELSEYDLSLEEIPAKLEKP